jgi:thioredoxin-like negative regulator of GroEL
VKTLSEVSASSPSREPGRIEVLAFVAPWSSVCEIERPVLEEVAASLPCLVSLRIVDAEKEPDLARANAITYLPTIVLLKNGVEHTRFVGAPSRAVLVSAITDACGGVREGEEP